MDRQHLRKQLERLLPSFNPSQIDMAVGFAEEEGDALSCERDLEEWAADLLERISEAMRIAPLFLGRAPAPPSQRELPRAPDAPRETDVPADIASRAEAFSAAVAAVANATQEVAEFRRVYLDGQVLPPDAAEAFLESRVLASHSLAQLKEWGVPLLGHTTTPDGESYREREGDRWVIYQPVRIDPPGVGAVVRFAEAGTWPIIEWVATTEWDAGWGETRAAGTFRYRQAALGSVLHDLRVMSDALASRFPWPPLSGTRAALWLTLTGAAHRIPTLRWELSFRRHRPVQYCELVLRAAPWATAEFIQQEFGRLRKRLLGSSGGNRSVSERNFRLLGFLVARVPTLAQTPDLRISWARWRELMAEWNADSPEQDRFKHVEAFWRGFQRAAKEILFCEYYWPSSDPPIPIFSRRTPNEGPEARDEDSE